MIVGFILDVVSQFAPHDAYLLHALVCTEWRAKFRNIGTTTHLTHVAAHLSITQWAFVNEYNVMAKQLLYLAARMGKLDVVQYIYSHHAHEYYGSDAFVAECRLSPIEMIRDGAIYGEQKEVYDWSLQYEPQSKYITQESTKSYFWCKLIIDNTYKLDSDRRYNHMSYCAGAHADKILAMQIPAWRLDISEMIIAAAKAYNKDMILWIYDTFPENRYLFTTRIAVTNSFLIKIVLDVLNIPLPEWEELRTWVRDARRQALDSSSQQCIETLDILYQRSENASTKQNIAKRVCKFGIEQYNYDLTMWGMQHGADLSRVLALTFVHSTFMQLRLNPRIDATTFEWMTFEEALRTNYRLKRTTVRKLVEKNEPWMNDLLNMCIVSNGAALAVECARYGNLEILQRIDTKDVNASARVEYAAASEGHLHILQYIHSIKCVSPLLHYFAIRNGHFNVVSWTIKNIHYSSENMLRLARERGYTYVPREIQERDKITRSAIGFRLLTA